MGSCEHLRGSRGPDQFAPEQLFCLRSGSQPGRAGTYLRALGGAVAVPRGGKGHGMPFARPRELQVRGCGVRRRVKGRGEGTAGERGGEGPDVSEERRE